ncbi:hypothetical protein EPR50_G00075510 [Perca flavescens]|uniref:Uncharacterized protein n=1 Tax=Perca flavescens TaxID=8167 RepID=A0A484D593_PERFV|nr:hypothetical protein EPR50_G00075510 [Perca flavescens]
MNLDYWTQRTGKGRVVLSRSSWHAVLCARTSSGIHGLPPVDTTSAGNALCHTWNNVNQQETPPVPNVEKDSEEVRNFRHPVKAALNQLLAVGRRV